MNYILKYLPWLFIFIGVVITCTFLWGLHNDGYHFVTTGITLVDTVHVASFLGGVLGPLISAAGFFFLYLNLSEQRQSFRYERLESRFFEMVKYHRENINEMTFTYCEHPVEKKFATAEKRKVFKLIHKQFEDLHTECDFLFENKRIHDIYENDYFNKLNQNKTIVDRKTKPLDYAKLDLLYLIIFFGVSKDGVNTISQLTQFKYKKTFTNKILAFAALKPKKEHNFWGDWLTFSKYSSVYKIQKLDSILEERESNKSIPGIGSLKARDLETIWIFHSDSYDKYYGGHQFRLGHYFRNFYQAVQFIHSNKYLTHIEKYEYIKVLRAQLSTYEQIIFFLNSVSQLGRLWEYEKKAKPEAEVKEHNHLITIYNLIKNIPNKEVLKDIAYSSFYPLVSYEVLYDEAAKEKRKLFKKRINIS